MEFKIKDFKTRQELELEVQKRTPVKGDVIVGTEKELESFHLSTKSFVYGCPVHLLREEKKTTRKPVKTKKMDVEKEEEVKTPKKKRGRPKKKD